jgi:hypothetical protein
LGPQRPVSTYVYHPCSLVTRICSPKTPPSPSLVAVQFVCFERSESPSHSEPRHLSGYCPLPASKDCPSVIHVMSPIWGAAFPNPPPPAPRPTPLPTVGFTAPWFDTSLTAAREEDEGGLWGKKTRDRRARMLNVRGDWSLDPQH